MKYFLAFWIATCRLSLVGGPKMGVEGIEVPDVDQVEHPPSSDHGERRTSPPEVYSHGEGQAI